MQLEPWRSMALESSSSNMMVSALSNNSLLAAQSGLPQKLGLYGRRGGYDTCGSDYGSNSLHVSLPKIVS